MPRSSEKSTEPRRKRGEEEEEKGKEWGGRKEEEGRQQKARTEVSVWEGDVWRIGKLLFTTSVTRT